MLCSQSFVPQVLPTQTTSNGFCGLLAKNFCIDCWRCSFASFFALPCHPLAARAHMISSMTFNLCLKLTLLTKAGAQLLAPTVCHSLCSLTFSPEPPRLLARPPPGLCDIRTCRSLLKYIQLCCKQHCPARPYGLQFHHRGNQVESKVNSIPAAASMAQ